MIGRHGVIVLAAALVAAPPVFAQGAQGPQFRHRAHERVFPVCTGCHAGIVTGDTTTLYPDVTACVRCHDGQTEERINWRRPSGPRPSNLKFQHVRHAAEMAAAGDSMRCQTCHQEAGTTSRMAVGGARPALCVACHGHEAPAHLVRENRCTTCHLALPNAPVTAAQIADFPKPTSHEASDFLLAHAPQEAQAQASCTICHARESCERCHVNAAAVPAIAALGRDERVAELVAGRTAEYPTPPAHRKGSWRWEHAEQAQTRIVECSNCHAQTSCRACHGAADVRAIAKLPEAVSGGPGGVEVEAGPSPHPPGFAQSHGTQAVATETSCRSCHTDPTPCLACHEGPGQTRFHGANFRERHATEAYGNEQNCASCHSVEVFCRSCHQATGLGSRGRLDVAFHTAEPLWLLGHGQSARQNLTSCQTCHRQSDCAQCHSALGAWRINPHGPGFTGTAEEAGRGYSCLLCHRAKPEDR